MKTKIQNIAAIAKMNTKRSDSLETRKDYLVTLLDFEFSRTKIIICDKDLPAAGRSFAVIELSDRFRINYRCGYSRHNYAPCIEVMK